MFNCSTAQARISCQSLRKPTQWRLRTTKAWEGAAGDFTDLTWLVSAGTSFTWSYTEFIPIYLYIYAHIVGMYGMIPSPYCFLLLLLLLHTSLFQRSLVLELFISREGWFMVYKLGAFPWPYWKHLFETWLFFWLQQSFTSFTSWYSWCSKEEAVGGEGVSFATHLPLQGFPNVAIFRPEEVSILLLVSLGGS